MFDIQQIHQPQSLAEALQTAARYPQAVIIVEEPLAAHEIPMKIFRDVYASINKKNDLLVIGLNTNDSEDFREWSGVFSRVLKFPGKDFSLVNREFSKLPDDLLIMLYVVFILRQFFPSALFSKIFEEEGLNPGILHKALDLLYSMGIIDSVNDPQPRLADFLKLAETIPAESREKANAIVRNRLLSWESGNRIRPCFNLLSILHKLGGSINESLCLRALRGDINNGSWNGFALSFSNGQIDLFAKKENVRLLEWIFKTQKALASQKPDEITEAFRLPPPSLPGTVFSGIKAQVLSNLCAFGLGKQDVKTAAVVVKELMLLNQGLKDGGIPAYRYFSLLNLLRQKIDDTLEYSSFAIDLAEKSGNKEELVKSLYFASSADFLYGNISGACRLIMKAEKFAADLGWLEWAFRSRFFLGRCFFECGRYQEALDVFSSLEKKVPPVAEKTLADWIFRTKIYHSVSSYKKPKKFIPVRGVGNNGFVNFIGHIPGSKYDNTPEIPSFFPVLF